VYQESGPGSCPRSMVLPPKHLALCRCKQAAGRSARSVRTWDHAVTAHAVDVVAAGSFGFSFRSHSMITISPDACPAQVGQRNGADIRLQPTAAQAGTRSLGTYRNRCSGISRLLNHGRSKEVAARQCQFCLGSGRGRPASRLR